MIHGIFILIPPPHPIDSFSYFFYTIYFFSFYFLLLIFPFDTSSTWLVYFPVSHDCSVFTCGFHAWAIHFQICFFFLHTKSHELYTNNSLCKWFLKKKRFRFHSRMLFTRHFTFLLDMFAYSRAQFHATTSWNTKVSYLSFHLFLALSFSVCCFFIFSICLSFSIALCGTVMKSQCVMCEWLRAISSPKSDYGVRDKG